MAGALSTEVIKSGTQTHEEPCGCFIFKVITRHSICILLPKCYLLEDPPEHLHFIQVELNLNYKWKMNKSNCEISGKQKSFITKNLSHLKEGEGKFSELLSMQKNTAPFPHPYFFRWPRIHPHSCTRKHNFIIWPHICFQTCNEKKFIAFFHIQAGNGGM